MRPASSHGLDEVEPIEANPGIVLATYPMLKPRMDCSGPMTNAVGGRPTERLGVNGGIVRGPPVLRGGYPRIVPLPTKINPGEVLELYPEMQYVEEFVGTNDVGGRPDERLGKYGSFTRGVRVWSGGEPSDAPKKEQHPCGVALEEYPSLHELIVEEDILDEAPTSEGIVLGKFPELTKPSRAEVQVREKLPLRLKDNYIKEKERALNFKPWVVRDWKPKLGLLPNNFSRDVGNGKVRHAAAPCA